MARRILVARAADVANLNAQCKNAQHILRYWRSTDYRPSIVSFSDPDPAVADNPNVDIIHLPDNRLWRAALFATYMRGFDAIFYPGLHHCADWLALRTRKAIGRWLPVITTMESLVGKTNDDSVEQWYDVVAKHKVYCGLMPPAEFRRHEEIVALADHVIAISPFLARMAANRYGDKVSVLPLGIDSDLFRRPFFERHARPRVVGVGTVYARKRPKMFLNLAAKFPQADFVWFGDGNLRHDLLAEIARQGLNNLQFPGALQPDQLARELTTSDILVLPSFAEGVPKVTQEAAAAGLAQIIFGFYEAPTVVDGTNGFVVWSDEHLFDRLAKLISDPDLTESMGRAGQRMAQQWSWELIAPQWENRIIEVCTRGQVN